MLYLLTAVFCFLISIIMHISWCRLRKDCRLHLLSFFLFNAAGLILSARLGYFICQQEIGPHQTFWFLPLQGSSIVLFVLLVPFYLVFYYSTVLESPSREILFLVKDKPGISDQEIFKRITNDRFVTPRISALLSSGCVFIKDNRYYLKPGIYWMMRVLNIMQNIYGRRISG